MVVDDACSCLGNGGLQLLQMRMWVFARASVCHRVGNRNISGLPVVNPLILIKKASSEMVDVLSASIGGVEVRFLRFASRNGDATQKCPDIAADKHAGGGFFVSRGTRTAAGGHIRPSANTSERLMSSEVSISATVIGAIRPIAPIGVACGRSGQR